MRAKYLNRKFSKVLVVLIISGLALSGQFISGLNKAEAVSSGVTLVLAPPKVDKKSGATKISVKYSGVDHFCYIQIVLSTAKPKPEIYYLYNGVTQDGKCIGSPTNPATLTHVFSGLKPGANVFVAGAQYREGLGPRNIDSNKQTVVLPATYKPTQPPPPDTNTKPPVTTVPGNLPIPADGESVGNPELPPGENSGGSEGVKPPAPGDDECPLQDDGEGVEGVFYRNFVATPVCGALKLLINMATGIADYVINSLFVPSLGIQYGR